MSEGKGSGPNGEMTAADCKPVTGAIDAGDFHQPMIDALLSATPDATHVNLWIVLKWQPDRDSAPRPISAHFTEEEASNAGHQYAADMVRDVVRGYVSVAGPVPVMIMPPVAWSRETR